MAHETPEDNKYKVRRIIEGKIRSGKWDEVAKEQQRTAMSEIDHVKQTED